MLLVSCFLGTSTKYSKQLRDEQKLPHGITTHAKRRSGKESRVHVALAATCQRFAAQMHETAVFFSSMGG